MSNPIVEGLIKGFTPRRIVTGHDASGDSIISSDSYGPERNATGPFMFDFWQETDASSFDSTHTTDNVAGPQVLGPPTNGHKFRFFTIPPAPKALSEMTAEEKTEYWSWMQEMFGTFGASHEWTGTRAPGMHKTETIDYIIVLQGKVALVLDKDVTDLKPFDVVVQRGTNHSWYVKPGDEPCMMVAVLIDSKVRGVNKKVKDYVKAKGGNIVAGEIPAKL